MSYVGKIWLLRPAGYGASGKPDTLIGLPRRALPSRNDPFHSKNRVRAAATEVSLGLLFRFGSHRLAAAYSDLLIAEGFEAEVELRLRNARESARLCVRMNGARLWLVSPFRSHQRTRLEPRWEIWLKATGHDWQAPEQVSRARLRTGKTNVPPGAQEVTDDALQLVLHSLGAFT